MSVPTLPETIRRLSCLCRIRGEADAVPLRTGVAPIESLSAAELTHLTEHARQDDLSSYPWLSPAIARRLQDLAARGVEPTLATARNGIPAVLRRLLELDAVSYEEAASLACDLGVATFADLRTSVQDGRGGARLTGAARVLAAEFRPVPLGRAYDVLTSLRELIAAHCPQFDDVRIAGDARRFEPLVGVLVIVAKTADPLEALDALASTPGVDDVLHRTRQRAVISAHGTEVDVRLARSDDHGTVLFEASGSNEHVRAVDTRRSKHRPCSREADVYGQAGLLWIPPELRNASGEIEAAAAGRLPRLVELADIRGDLHMHSTYSDGQDTLETMIAAAARLGYEYVAITDHSEGAAASRTVTLDQLARQREELERLRERFPRLSILHGIEAEILPGGRLDFADAVLERLDIVLASLHEAAGHDGATLTRRCVQAIRHPLVNIITHPANRLVGRRDGYPLNYQAVFEAAAETGTALEIDGAPSHLDLDGERARAAVGAGVMVSIDSDSHRATALGRQMQLGVGTARRGWVEPHHVLNTRPLAELCAFIHAKRAGKQVSTRLEGG